MRIGITDIGANLAHDSFDHDRAALLERAAEVGVERIIITGSCEDSSPRALELVREHSAAPVALHATVGMHPHHAHTLSDAVLADFRSLAMEEEVVALGECGLDYHRNFSPREAQLDAFKRQLDLACRLGMPLFLHQRDAHADFMELLRPRLPDLPGVVVHCFTGTQPELADYIEHDCYVGITGWICDERRGHHLKEFIGDIPADRVLIETDAPYLLPRNLAPKPKSRRNEPMYLITVAQAVADARGEALETLVENSSANARRLFQLGAG